MIKTKMQFRILTKDGHLSDKDLSSIKELVPVGFIFKIDGSSAEFSYESSWGSKISYDDKTGIFKYCEDKEEIDRSSLRDEPRVGSAIYLTSAEELEVVLFEFEMSDGKDGFAGDICSECEGYYAEILSLSFENFDGIERFVKKEVIDNFNKSQKDWFLSTSAT